MTEHGNGIGTVGEGAEYLAYRLGEEEYGIDIQKVQELRGYETVTRLANAQEFVKGVVNLRGIIVPIIDMRLRLGLGDASYGPTTVVIILNIAGKTVGMVADSVSDVVNLLPAQIKPAPDMPESRHLIGIGTADERMILLVDIEKQMAASDVGIPEPLAA